MSYIFETKLPERKSVSIALKGIKGLGKSRAQKICKKLGFSRNFLITNLSGEQTKKLIILLGNETLLGTDLMKFKNLALKNLISIKLLRGIRKVKGLPVRGQRTHTNAKTARKNLN